MIQAVSRSGEVAFEDVWRFGHRDPDTVSYFTRIAISPVANTSAPSQVRARSLPVASVTMHDDDLTAVMYVC